MGIEPTNDLDDNEKIQTIKRELDNLHRELAEQKKLSTHYYKTLKDIYSSETWQIVRNLWRFSIFVKSLMSWENLLTKVRGLHFPKKLHLTRRRKRKKNRLFIDQFHDSSLPKTKRVALITQKFYDIDGDRVFLGGAERYLVELAKIIKGLGYEPLIIQCGNSNWERFYDTLRVIGLATKGRLDIFQHQLSKTDFAAELIIYSPFTLCSFQQDVPSIGISHGIFWDHPIFQKFPSGLQKTIKKLLKSVNLLDRVVSVDTNTINWLRATSFESSEKCSYIPNFVDLDQFQPIDKADNHKIVILYPRRLYRPRGYFLVREAIEDILNEHPLVEFLFVGNADPEEEINVIELITRFKDRVQWYSLPMSQMHEAYQKADISIIPTVHSEGTSLSCLEALASGNAVIATNVGGLPDIVLNHYNGLLVDPDPLSIKNALSELILDKQKRKFLSRNGRKVAEVFDISHWRDNWKKLLINYLPFNIQHKSFKRERFIVFPYTGIGWHGVKQRPHHIARIFSEIGFNIIWYDPSETDGCVTNRIHLMKQGSELYLFRPVLFIYYPFSFQEIEKYQDPIVIYDVLDDISIFDNPNDENIGRLAREYQQKLLERADIVIASSQVILNEIKKTRSDVVFVPNGVDSKLFNYEQTIPTKKIRSKRKPLIGYHGAIATWFDAELIAETARLRPNYHFVLVGPVSDPRAQKRLMGVPNIQLVGAVPYEEIPSYIAAFDVGLLPFILSKLTHAVRPLKVLEYLAMNIPVVSTPIQEILDWPGLTFARTPDQFACAIDEALHQGPVDIDLEGLKQLLNQSSWEFALEPLLRQIEIFQEKNEKRTENSTIPQ